MREYDEGEEAFLPENGRSCFGLSTLFGSGDDEVISGGYNGRVYREFSQTDEDLDTGTTKKVRARLVGKHLVTEDYTEVSVKAIHVMARFGGQPTGSSVHVGMLLDPITRGKTIKSSVDMIGDYANAAYFNRSYFNQCYFNVSSDAQVDVHILQKARTLRRI